MASREVLSRPLRRVRRPPYGTVVRGLAALEPCHGGHGRAVDLGDLGGLLVLLTRSRGTA